ncbi:MAG: hypothetical protein ACK5L3_03095 [Oscillospiraceae bacterium]
MGIVLWGGGPGLGLWCLRVHNNASFEKSMVMPIFYPIPAKKDTQNIECPRAPPKANRAKEKSEGMAKQSWPFLAGFAILLKKTSKEAAALCKKSGFGNGVLTKQEETMWEF